jgi:hypothetical protein
VQIAFIRSNIRFSAPETLTRISAEARALSDELTNLARRPSDKTQIKAVRAQADILAMQLFSDDCRRVMEKLVQHESPCYLTISSDVLFLPWQILPISHGSKEVLADKFCIECSLPSPLGHFNHDAIHAGGNRGDLALGWHEDLKQASQVEIPHLTRLRSRFFRDGFVRELPEYQDANRFVLDVLEMSPKILHLACHVEVGATANENSVSLRKSQTITEADIRRSTSLSGEPHPFKGTFLFLNACNGSAASHLDKAAFVRMWMERGMQALLAPVGEINDFAAAQFSKLFYDRFARGSKTIVSCVREAALEMQNSGDLTGLQYITFGRGGTTLVDDQSTQETAGYD